MANEINSTIDTLHELGLTPLDWVDAEKFSELTGIAKKKLPNRKTKWPEDLVWTRQDNNVYYSMKGYNRWMTEQAELRYRKASGLDREDFKSTSPVTNKRTTLRSRTQSLRKVSMQPLRLDVT